MGAYPPIYLRRRRRATTKLNWVNIGEQAVVNGGPLE